MDVLEVSEVIRCVLLCMLEMLEVAEVMRCVLSVRWRSWKVGAVCWRC